MLRTLECRAAGGGGYVKQRADHAGAECVCAMENLLHSPALTTRGRRGRQVWVRFRAEFGPETRLRLEKFLACYTSLDSPGDALVSLARREARAAAELGFEALAREQRDYLRRFWAAGDVEVEGPGRIRQGVRYSLFHLLQASPPPAGPVRSIPAKGLTGEGYEGHYFWDTEIFVLPYLTYTLPSLARGPLAWRIRHLDAARSRARQLGLRGALFPWRTIDGDEASPYFPAGTAQYHINAGIAYALRRYARATGGDELLLAGGAELLFETARMWLSLGDRLPPPDGAFCLNAVTGPDEYTALVNNNVYTNLMAADHLTYAAEVYRRLARDRPAAWKEICSRIGLEAGEAAAWEEAAAAVRIPFDESRGIHPQDDSFLDKAVWDFAASKGKIPLLLYYHPLVI
jgi:trehalose/maltose hydrolase-like predicted phosphorylase